MGSHRRSSGRHWVRIKGIIYICRRTSTLEQTQRGPVIYKWIGTFLIHYFQRR